MSESVRVCACACVSVCVCECACTHVCVCMYVIRFSMNRALIFSFFFSAQRREVSVYPRNDKYSFMHKILLIVQRGIAEHKL